MTSSILIAGGGSAGWITANVLAASFERAGGLAPQITLIEAPDIPIIGVGEATVPSIRRTLQHIGIGEREFMRACDATFKTLIRFDDWSPGISFDHPFDRRERPATDMAVEDWLRHGQDAPSFDGTFSVLSRITAFNLAPKAVGWPDYGSPFPYAYHLDAVKLARALTEIGLKRGIRHVLGRITDVNVAASGSIESVELEDKTIHSADLFVDCTGFAARLVGQALGIEKTSFSKQLLCDRAVTLQIPFETYRPERIRTYTQATARSSGWQWDINLQTRRGVGYVYSSSFQTSDEAERELRAAEGPSADDLEARHIAFESHKRKVSWQGNCVAVGLADGFLEPLESSGLYMIEYAAQALADLLPHAGPNLRIAANRFNANMTSLYAEVLEYVNLHYMTSTRRDTAFWRAASDQGAIVDSLRDKLPLWRTKRPSELDFDGPLRLFSIESYEYLLFGMGHTARASSGVSTQRPDLSGAVAKCKERLPNHEEWLSKLA